MTTKMYEGIRKDGTVCGYFVETYFAPCKGIASDTYKECLIVVADNGATDIETRISFKTLESDGWSKIDRLESELAELRKDRERLDAIEDMVRNSRTGVTFKHENYSEDGYVVERGFNITRYHFRSELEKTLREAIDNSMKEVK